MEATDKQTAQAVRLARYHRKGLDHGGVGSMTVPIRVHDHDDTVEAHYTGLERRECALCYRGLVYIGRLEMTDEGEEIVEAVPCWRCAR